MKLDDLVGKKFGKWSVIKRVSSDRSGTTRYECVCECGKIAVVYSKHLKSGQSKSCRCGLPRGDRHKQWTGFQGLPGWYWNKIEHHANLCKGRVSIPLEITKEDAWDLYLKQNQKCALTDLPLVMGLNCQKNIHTASLDRIDSSLGYVIGNIQWVHKDVNKMKNTYSQEYFVEMCKRVSAKFN